MRKGVSPVVVSIFLIIIVVGLAFAFLAWSRAAQETVQEDVERGVERETRALKSGLSIGEVGDGRVTVKNTGDQTIETEDMNLLLDGGPTETSTTTQAIGPGQSVTLETDDFLPGVREITVVGPLDIGDRVTAPLLYEGTVGFWEFLPEDEGSPDDRSPSDNEGTLEGTTRVAYSLDGGRGGTAEDSTSYGNDGLLEGDPDWVQGVFRNALRFNGGSDRVEVDSVASFPSDAITASLWVRTTDSGDGILSYAVSGSDNEFLLFDSSGLRVDIGGASLSTGVSFNDGDWHHLTVTWRSSDGRLRVYLDGDIVHEATHQQGYSIANGGTLVLAQDQDSPGGGFDTTQAFEGRIDEVGVHSRPLMPVEVGRRFEGERMRFSDYVEGIHNFALSLDGENSHVRVPDSNSLDIPDQLTLEAWVRMDGGSSDSDGIVWKKDSYALFINSSSDKPKGRIRTTGGGGRTITSSVPVSRNEWHHVVFTKNDSALALYVDGSQAAETSFVGQTAFTDTPLLIGARSVSGGDPVGPFDGLLDYVSVYDTALSPEQIKSIYESGTQ